MVENAENNAAKEPTQEQILFYEKIANYIGRHPEFVSELTRKMEEEEKLLSENKKYKSAEENKESNEKKKKSILKLDDEKINTISQELSGLLFDRSKSEKSVLEKTIQDAFSGLVKNYLSKYAD